MQTFLIISSSKKQQEKEVAKLLTPFHIDPFDIQIVKPENSIGIEEIRELKLAISLKPFKSQTKAVVIEEAQKLTIEAQNALLKTLEEPPDHTIIVLLAAGNIDTLLPTVVSRCQVVQPPTTNPSASFDRAQDKSLRAGELEIRSKKLEILFEGGVEDKLALAEELAKDKQIVLPRLEKMILAIRQKVIFGVSNNQNNSSIAQLLNYLITFQRTHTLLSTTNVNPRFTLENLFLAL